MQVPAISLTELTVPLLTKATGLFLTLVFSTLAFAKASEDYLPPDAEMDTSIPSRESLLGWEIGDWRIQHPSLVQYMYKLAELSDRVSIKVTGYTYEQKPLLQLVITSAENQSKLESLRQEHLQAANNGSNDAPLVVWLGYSVHVDEASGSNAAPVVAWYLAASQSDYVKSLLQETIVIIDPSLNPDGLDRFAVWSNSNSSKNPVADTNGRIHHQAWPPGRTNHYLFDLNRDWLSLVHPESRARIEEFHRWLPHVITDHHETGDDGFFFQPGAPTRQHPLTTQANLDMTRKLVPYHTESFDSAGEMYFTEDTYDDFFYGKGSTYPDINGSIGILYEQPRVNGAVMERRSGPLEFTEAIHNHIRMSLSTLKGAYELRDEFKQYQAGFFKEMRRRAGRADFSAWVIGDANDRERAAALMEVFKRHQVTFHELREDIKLGEQTFRAGQAWVIPAKQRQFGVAQAMLETRSTFTDNTFYDVSAWNLAMAYDLPVAKLSKMPEITDPPAPRPGKAPLDGAVAWVVPWQQLGAPALLQKLLDMDARVRIATRPFSMEGDSGPVSFTEGSLVLLPGIQTPVKSSEVFDLLQQSSAEGLDTHSFQTLLSSSGPGLGTSHYKPASKVKPLLVVGDDVRSYDAGEAWFQMDQRLGLAPVMVEISRLKSVSLSDYTHLMMVNGRYSRISKSLQQRISDWVKDGGTLVTVQGAASWAESLCFDEDNCKKTDEKEIAEAGPDLDIPYGEYDDRRAQKTIGGAIVQAKVDTSHPIAYGFSPEAPLFRRGATLLKPSDNPFSTPVRYSASPLLSGYIGTERLAEMANQPAVIAERQGKGVVVRFANNPIFRGFWRGTERLWINAIYFGPLVRTTELPK
jgi:hypothetical protein